MGVIHESATSKNYSSDSNNHEKTELSKKASAGKMNWLQDIKDAFNFVVFNPDGLLIVGPLMLLLESAALKVITKRVAYTEIDYKAYMEQIEMIKIDKCFDYSQIEGGTGPLVYPAGHVLIYKFMYWITSGMNNLYYGQVAFRYLYLSTLFLQLIIYNYLQLPPIFVVLASLSKRLHSIYVLRLFNDSFTTFFIVWTVLLFTAGTRLPLRSSYRYLCALLGSVTYSFAVSVKMNALLYLPAILLAIYLSCNGNLLKSSFCILSMVLWQVSVALPFLSTYPWEYLHCAFNFKRQFMFQWSINWQFIGEMGFQDSLFQKSLLLSQMLIIIMIIFVAYPGRLLEDALQSLKHPMTDILLVHENSTPDLDNVVPVNHTTNDEELSNIYAEQQQKLQKASIPLLLILTNFVGILFARSLHYQFLSWYHWTIPALLHWSQLNTVVCLVLFVLNEYCWNVYPPNPHSSALFVFVNSIILLSVIHSLVTRNLSNFGERNNTSSRIKTQDFIEKKRS